MAEYTENATLRRQVRNLLSWNQQQYAEYQEQCGLAYLQAIAPEYPQVTKQISKSAIFWKWWIRHWELRDLEFVESIDNTPDDVIIDPVAEYNELHDPRTLAIAIYLNGQVLQESYAEMIGQLTQKQKEAA